MRKTCLSAIVAGLLAAPAVAQAGDLTVTLENVANAEGVLLAGVVEGFYGQ